MVNVGMYSVGLIVNSGGAMMVILRKIMTDGIDALEGQKTVS